MADDNDNTCDEIEQAPASKPKRKSSTAAYQDPGAIANAFGSIVSVFQRSPVSSLIVTAILAVSALGYASYANEGFRGSLFALLPASSSTLLEAQASKARKEIRKEDEVCNLVENVGKRISAHRLIYFRYSGESTPTTNNPLPWRYTSAVCVYPKPGVDYDIAGAQSVPASLSSELQIVMFPVGNREGACGLWHVEDIKSSYLRSRFDKNGTDLKIACGQVSPQGLPTGSLSADWLTRSAITESEEEVQRIIRDTLSTITELQSKISR
ncbi:hypothetical protein OKC48_04160 [Methylorubrum extorquens]|uniref:hypothetical protein n=1 Tax=Methylorubrum extorquens TaxID=408 RepID=UPI00223738FE|nr:hypothetical protein [Methylorubrum extorquens]UYW27714.1 hypothetical protein OKC48_04160 [Methylorubrum extorquens]